MRRVQINHTDYLLLRHRLDDAIHDLVIASVNIENSESLDATQNLIQAQAEIQYVMDELKRITS